MQPSFNLIGNGEPISSDFCGFAVRWVLGDESFPSCLNLCARVASLFSMCALFPYANRTPAPNFSVRTFRLSKEALFSARFLRLYLPKEIRKYVPLLRRERPGEHRRFPWFINLSRAICFAASRDQCSMARPSSSPFSMAFSRSPTATQSFFIARAMSRSHSSHTSPAAKSTTLYACSILSSRFRTSLQDWQRPSRVLRLRANLPHQSHYPLPGHPRGIRLRKALGRSACSALSGTAMDLRFDSRHSLHS